MAGKIGWEQFNFGARNVHDGERDVARNLVVFIGIPVALVYIGANHRIDMSAVKDPAHRDRLRRFLAQYRGWPEEKARAFRDTVEIPLKKRLGLGVMAAFGALVCAAGVLALCGVVAVFAFATMPRAMNPVDHMWLGGAIACMCAFLGGLGLYYQLRRPSARQARIRSVVSQRLGPFTDVADWKVDSLGPLFPLLGVVSLDPAETLAEAESLRRSGKFEEALLWARIVIAFAHPREERALVEQAETLTDECLGRLEGIAPPGGA
jgi:hypothetical protein